MNWIVTTKYCFWAPRYNLNWLVTMKWCSWVSILPMDSTARACTSKRLSSTCFLRMKSLIKKLWQFSIWLTSFPLRWRCKPLKITMFFLIFCFFLSYTVPFFSSFSPASFLCWPGGMPIAHVDYMNHVRSLSGQVCYISLLGLNSLSYLEEHLVRSIMVYYVWWDFLKLLVGSVLKTCSNISACMLYSLKVTGTKVWFYCFQK